MRSIEIDIGPSPIRATTATFYSSVINYLDYNCCGKIVVTSVNRLCSKEFQQNDLEAPIKIKKNFKSWFNESLAYYFI